MRVLHFHTTDGGAGAATCAYGIHRALRAAGCRSTMLVRNKRTEDPDVIEAQPIGRVARALRRLGRMTGVSRVPPSASYTFNFDATPPLKFKSLLPFPKADVGIIFVHWIDGLLSSPWIRRLYEHYQCPIVWFLADQQPMTGGCHYTFGCSGFTRSCGKCPQLRSDELLDRSRGTWLRKSRNLSDLPITFVCGANEILQHLKSSSLFGHCRTVRVPGAFDATVYRPRNQHKVRLALGLPPDKKILFFGACGLEDPRKGAAAFLQAQERLHSLLSEAGGPIGQSDVFLLFAGNDFAKLPLATIRFPFHSMGFLTPSQLAMAYQASDLFVCTSTADVGPGMVIESLLCGTPVAAFSVGICAEILENGKNGLVVGQGDTEALAKALKQLLSWSLDELERQRVRDTVLSGYSDGAAADAYLKLFRELASTHAVPAPHGSFARDFRAGPSS